MNRIRPSLYLPMLCNHTTKKDPAIHEEVDSRACTMCSGQTRDDRVDSGTSLSQFNTSTTGPSHTIPVRDMRTEVMAQSSSTLLLLSISHRDF